MERTSISIASMDYSAFHVQVISYVRPLEVNPTISTLKTKISSGYTQMRGVKFSVNPTFAGE